MTENDLYEQIAHYMNLQYPNVIYRFDLGGVWTPSHKARNLYGRLNKRAWPDLFIACPKKVQLIDGDKQPYFTIANGLFIELKIKSPYLKDGKTLRKNDHLAEQAMVLKALESQGYKAVFATGFDEATQIIDSYLRNKNVSTIQDF